MSKQVKVRGSVRLIQKIINVFYDLYKLNEWVVRRQMDFNIDKCRIMNVGRENPQQVQHKQGKS